MAQGDPWVIYERLVAADQKALALPERRLVALGSLRTELNNGGFDQYFFKSSGDLVLTAMEAARAAEANDLADLLARALEVLNCKDPSTRERRQEALESLEDDAFEGLDEEYLALENSTDLDALMRAVLG